MSTKELKSEARQKLPLNIHLALAVYAIEFFLLVSVIAIVVMGIITFATAAQTAYIANAYPTASVTQTTDGQGDASFDSSIGGSVSISATEDQNTDKKDDKSEAKKPKVGVGSRVASVLMIVYGVLIFLAMLVMFGMVNFSLIDYYLATYRCKPYGVRGLGETLARGGIGKVLVMNVIRTLLGFLLLLCLIVPGVIYLIRTSMANHLLIANPKLTAKGALRASNKVMTGKTAGYFVVGASFIGWYLLCIVTFGLGFIFVLPYANLTKTVYYKRNLQGDKAVYNYVAQPGAGQFYQQPVQQILPEQPEARAVVPPIEQQGVQAEVQDPPVSPIDTLDAEDIRDINDAMLDVSGQASAQPVKEQQAHEPTAVDIQAQPVTLEDIPEVPIYPVSSPGSAVERNGDEMHKIDGFDIFESVRELSQTEVDASDSYERKVKNLFDGGQTPKSTPARNYFGTQVGQSPDDFVTSEVPSIDNDTEGSVLDDDSFAEFLRTFDKENSESQPEDIVHTAPRRPVSGMSHTPDAHRVVTPPSQRAASTPVNESSHEQDKQPEFGATLTTRNRTSDGESRADRARREREERMRNLTRK